VFGMQTRGQNTQTRPHTTKKYRRQNPPNLPTERGAGRRGPPPPEGSWPPPHAPQAQKAAASQTAKSRTYQTHSVRKTFNYNELRYVWNTFMSWTDREFSLVRGVQLRRCSLIRVFISKSRLIRIMTLLIGNVPACPEYLVFQESRRPGWPFHTCRRFDSLRKDVVADPRPPPGPAPWERMGKWKMSWNCTTWMRNLTESQSQNANRPDESSEAFSDAQLMKFTSKIRAQAWPKIGPR